ncbi:MAG TPA: class A beta-lactamase-related serine hydrolase [Candidatus Paceibacterota bacterium]|nr:class A beta-lactamase-related serine hydrolase [Candidatus Pacearchaeota archaeon]HRZ50914.1 class A beta-lactamase-related serine hydrolase [Candidatus Paceibacterota bacterium]HSA36635.1 class A beta-lactamase-related serine hydrolase [Candidatus Paceibacterota bacterium]
MKLSINQRSKAIICFLIVTNLATAGYVFYLRKQNLEYDNPYPLIDISRNFIDQKHYLTTINPLREKVKAMVKEYGQDSVSVYIEYLNTGANISVNPELYVWPASLTKVPLAMAVVKKIEKNEWQFQNELVLMAGDANDKSGDGENPLFEYPVGTRFTIENLLKELLMNSDNTAYYILLRNLHQDDLKDVIQALGMEQLFTNEGRVSAKEYSRMLRSLYSASYLSRENSEQILEWLDASSFDDFLASEVSQEVIFPHKYGVDDLSMSYSDSGIVYLPNRPYLISVMVQADKNGNSKNEKEKAGAFMREISKEAYQFFLNANN